MKFILETSKRWTVRWYHGGIGNLYGTRYAAMVDMVCEAHWTKAVLAAGFDPDQVIKMETRNKDFADKINEAIHEPALVRKVWRRLSRRKDGPRIIRVTVNVSGGWA